MNVSLSNPVNGWRVVSVEVRDNYFQFQFDSWQSYLEALDTLTMNHGEHFTVVDAFALTYYLGKLCASRS